jgi:rRNA-processing protein FCF1
MNKQSGKDTQLHVLVDEVFFLFKYYTNVTLSSHNDTLFVLDVVICLPESVSCLLARANPKIRFRETFLTGN